MKKKSTSRNVTVSASMNDKWMAESDCDTLIRAAEIKSDSKRLKAALAVAEERKSALAEIDEDSKEESTESKADKKREGDK